MFGDLRFVGNPVTISWTFCSELAETTVLVRKIVVSSNKAIMNAFASSFSCATAAAQHDAQTPCVTL